MKSFHMQSLTKFLHVAPIKSLELPHRKTNQGLRALLYIGTSLWNKLDKSLKISVSLNAFKHNLKDYYFKKGNKKE